MTMNCCCGTCNWCLANWKGENPAKSEKSLEEICNTFQARTEHGVNNIYSEVQEDGSVKVPIWLVWALHIDGRTYLRAVTMTERLANHYRKVLQYEGTAIHVSIERREANHLYGGVQP